MVLKPKSKFPKLSLLFYKLTYLADALVQSSTHARQIHIANMHAEKESTRHECS